MNKKNIAIITEGKNDILEILRLNNINLKILKPGEIISNDLDACDAVAILGGGLKEPILFKARERLLIEEQLKKGKKIFAEYCSSIGDVHCLPPVNTRYQRIAFLCKDINLAGVKYGDLLDDQCGMRIKPYPEFASLDKTKPILQFVTVHSHNRLSDPEKLEDNIEDRALWFDNPDNLMVCSFKLSNFIKARYAPKKKFKKIIKFILEWLTEEQIDVDCIMDAYFNGSIDKTSNFNLQLYNCIHSAFGWFNDAGILLNNGADGVKEGFATEIYPDGMQKVNSLVRADCTGEVSMAYFMHYLLKDDKRSLDISNQLSAFCFDFMMCKKKDIYME